MTKVVYTSTSRTPLARLVSPYQIVLDLLRYRGLIYTAAKRDFEATHRDNVLGLLWTILTPLIMLAIFTLVFGYIFGGKFNQKVSETPAEFALALFVGLSFFSCVGQSLTSSAGIILGNSVYVKTLSFPVETLPVASVMNILANLGIALALCATGFVIMHGFIHVTAIALLLHIICVALLSLGLTYFISALSVFVRDVALVTAPLSMVLMFTSAVFFPMESVPPRVAFLFRLNPIAVIVDQARGALLYGRWPDPVALGAVFIFSFLVAVGGYWFFMRTKPGFADVI